MATHAHARGVLATPQTQMLPFIASALLLTVDRRDACGASYVLEYQSHHQQHNSLAAETISIAPARSRRAGRTEYSDINIYYRTIA
jgi:hypothetical protein